MQNGRRSFVIPSGYQIFSVILTLIVVEMDQHGQIKRYWDMVLIGDSDTKKINMKRSKFSPHCSPDYAPKTPY